LNLFSVSTVLAIGGHIFGVSADSFGENVIRKIYGHLALQTASF
jgi:hypothetical protein